MNYQIIKDPSKLREFIEWLPELKENEQYYLCLFARSKYVNGEIVHIKSDKAQLKRFTSKKEFLYRKIQQLECKVGSYLQRDTPIPQEALALYITINPRDLWKATFSSLCHLAKCIQNSNRNMNPHQEVMSEIQRSSSDRRYVIVDVDSKNQRDLAQVMRHVNTEALSYIETRGGFHVLVRTDAVAEGYKKTWYQGMAGVACVDQMGDIMSPVPGCTQGDFVPTITHLNQMQ